MTRTIVVERRRALGRVHGRDPVKMIHGLATADIEALTPDRGAYTVFLTPKGRMVADARIFAADQVPDFKFGGAELLIDTDPAAFDPLAAHIRKFVPPLFARFESLGERRIVGAYGPRAREIMALALDQVLGRAVDLPADLPEHGIVWLNGAEASVSPPPFVVRTRLISADGWEAFFTEATFDALVAALLAADGEPAGEDELERLRIEAGTPRWGAELDEDTIPLEAGLLERALSQTKGCYTGQEVIVRILHRGHVNRHLRRLEFEADAPTPGTELFEAENPKPRGKVTSVAGPVGLGYVRREVEPGAELRAGSPDGPVVRVVALEREPQETGR